VNVDIVEVPSYVDSGDELIEERAFHAF